jgi:hypothetical protein
MAKATQRQPRSEGNQSGIEWTREESRDERSMDDARVSQVICAASPLLSLQFIIIACFVPSILVLGMTEGDVRMTM